MALTVTESRQLLSLAKRLLRTAEEIAAAVQQLSDFRTGAYSCSDVDFCQEEASAHGGAIPVKWTDSTGKARTSYLAEGELGSLLPALWANQVCSGHNARLMREYADKLTHLACQIEKEET